MPTPNMIEREDTPYDFALQRIEECLSEGRSGTSLDLSNLGLRSLPPEIGQLYALRVLYLNNNQIRSLPAEIDQLTSLRELYLDNNQLTSLPPEFGQLTALTKLYLDNNQLTSLPPEFGQLTALTKLYLYNNKLTSLPPEFGQLTALTQLDLSSNKLTSLPPEFGQLTALTLLRLSNNKLTSLPPEFGQLTALTILRLDENELTSLPPEFGQLTALTELYLYNNQLTSLPPEFGQLTTLTILDLSNNQLTSLPPEFGQLTALKELYLHGNTGLGLPAETLGPTMVEVAEHGEKPKPPLDILWYYFLIRPPALQGRGPMPKPAVMVREARLIVIGDGSAGKTSLVRALLHGKTAREAEETTRDVIVEDWPDMELKQPGKRKKQAVAVHVWDFGGQEPMHAAHPYFFTNRTLYLVVATARETGVEERISYWLKMVAAHGQGARALVAVNKTDQHPMDITQRELCAEHASCLPANPAEAFFPTACKAGKIKGIVALKAALMQQLQAMEQVWTEVPGEWMAAKQLLEKRRAQGEDTLVWNEWHDVCEEAGVPENERSKALNLLRDLGTVVSFPDDDHLSELGVLDPSWVTRAIYPLLSSHKLAAKGGLLERQELTALLGDAKHYPKHKHQWLIELMKKFELLFESEGRLLLPARLPKDPPAWTTDKRWTADNVLHLELRFDVLPESVISKFITRWYEQAAEPESWWRHGIAVKDSTGRCEALVRAFVGDPGKIELRLLGPKIARQHFVAELRGELRRLTQKLDGELWLMLNGIHAEKYDDLLVLVHEGEEREIKRVVAGKMMTFDLVKHLDLIEPTKAQQQALVQMNVIGGDAHGNAFGRGNTVRNKRSFNQKKI